MKGKKNKKLLSLICRLNLASKFCLKVCVWIENLWCKSVNLISCRLSKVDSWSCLNLVSCVEAMWRMERAHPHNPLVLSVFKPLTFTTPAPSTTLVTSIPQPILRCCNVVKKGIGQMSDIPSLQMLGASSLEMFVQSSIVLVPVLAGLLCTRPSWAGIHGAPNIKKLAKCVVNQIHKPDCLVLHASR